MRELIRQVDPQDPRLAFEARLHGERCGLLERPAEFWLVPNKDADIYPGRLCFESNRPGLTAWYGRSSYGCSHLEIRRDEKGLGTILFRIKEPRRLTPATGGPFLSMIYNAVHDFFPSLDQTQLCRSIMTGPARTTTSIFLMGNAFAIYPPLIVVANGKADLYRVYQFRENSVIHVPGGLVSGRFELYGSYSVNETAIQANYSARFANLDMLQQHATVNRVAWFRRRGFPDNEITGRELAKRVAIALRYAVVHGGGLGVLLLDMDRPNYRERLLEISITGWKTRNQDGAAALLDQVAADEGSD